MGLAFRAFALDVRLGGCMVPSLGEGDDDWWLIALRVVHVGSSMAWFGGAVIESFILFPAARALGPAGQPFIDQRQGAPTAPPQ
ncbi:MAG TPA: hypothetical protein VF349_03145 [Candidatus Limnocylindrales bacterium]